MTKLICPDCRHENEMERVYCHNCGARLNRSLLTKEKNPPPPVEEPAQIQKRLRKVINPPGLRTRVALIQLGKILLGAFIFAALLEMIRPPDLPPVTKSVDLGPQIGLDLESAVLEHRGARFTYSQADINSYLTTVFKRKKTSLEKPLLHFEGAQAMLEENVFHLNVARSLYGYSLHTGIAYRAGVKDGKINASVVAGSIGRMPIHPALMKYGAIMFRDVWAALSQDQKEVARMATLEFHPGAVVLIAPSAPEAPAPAAAP
jgi:hypothetical protein